MRFNSHVERLLVSTVALVNGLTAGQDGGRPVDEPVGDGLVDAVARAVRTQGYECRASQSEARALLVEVRSARQVIEAVADDDLERAASLVNGMLVATGARPQLDRDEAGDYRLHFHGPDDSFGRGWAAGIAAGLAMALGGDGGQRLGVCEAPGCDRVYVDQSKNSHRRFCGTRCQSRVKAAAHRRRASGG
jgi:predicted RNA-binding Zn ribbon-like protein